MDGRTIMPMSAEEFERFGYDSQDSCIVCGTRENVKSEPRFGYSVCKYHANVKPTDVNDLIQAKENVITEKRHCQRNSLKGKSIISDHEHLYYIWLSFFVSNLVGGILCIIKMIYN